MFTHHCSACSRRQLMFFSQVARSTEVADGIEVSFTCWCGEDQTALLADVTATRTTADIAAGDRGLVAA
ncbi:hypothetical protein GCM10009737_14450 [Nocardioides lentus]|uniref:Uncharacterized protein n=1 Tax=Nocardioides lentus TaxID=338077 RepID=A0ABP5AI10_9ACTN